MRSSMFDHDAGHLCRGRRVPHSDCVMVDNLEASSSLTQMEAETASAACPALSRLDHFIEFLNTSSVAIGLELVFLNLCLTVSKNLLSLIFKKNPDLLIF